jgi:type II secretory pathway component PulF
LESLSLTGRRAVELRRGMTLALIYPTIVVAMAYMAILFVMTFVVPVISQSYTQLLGTSSILLSSASRVGAWVAVWGWLVPFVAVGAFAWWRVRSGRAMRSLSERGGRRFLLRGASRWRWPSVRAALNDGRMATFAELLGLLDEHRVPLPQAIVLAADASGDRNMSRGARVIAERVERGERVTRREDLPSSFPPLLGWSLLAQMGQGSLQRTLATSAAMYRQRAVDAARWAALYMPIFLTVGVGGTAVVVEVLLVFVPFVNLMKQLAMP